MLVLRPYLINKSITRLTKRISLLRILVPFKIALALLCGLIGYQYFQTKIYQFPERNSFNGDVLYNPYESINGKWLKANFHAHSISWGGITNGHQTGDSIVSTYLKSGYDIAGISDYLRINPSIYVSENLAIPVYEHGMNVDKSHQLAIGAERVDYFDVSLWQTRSTRQFIINKLKETASVVCVNHPGKLRAYPLSNIDDLTGYECMEVLCRTRTYLSHWDEVLSSGRPVWILGNDDTHDLNREKFAISWSQLFVTEPGQAGVISALKRGSTVGVRRKVIINSIDSLQQWANQHEGQVVKKVITHDSTVTYLFNSTIQRVTLVGQNGLEKATYKHVDSVTYTFQSNDTYIRAVAETDTHISYMNPVLRYDGINEVANSSLARVEILPTLIMRISVVVAYGIIILLLFPSTINQLLYGNQKPIFANG
jgi:hypothetical protein